MKYSHSHEIAALFLVLAVLKGSTSAPACIPTCKDSQSPVLKVTPPSLIVPARTEVVFRCEVSVCQTNPSNSEIKWIKSDELPILVNPHRIDDRDITLTFVANKSIDISCYYLFNEANTNVRSYSNIARLQVIEECPITPTPTVEIEFLTDNQSSIELLWSPPCLWPGHYIEKFNIFIESRNDDIGSTYNKTVSYNSTQNYSESLNMTIDDQSSQDCSELFVKIAAFDRYRGWLSKVVTKRVERYPLRPVSFNNSSLNTRVFFSPLHLLPTVDEMIVKINFTVPLICSYQELEYTIIIYNITDSSSVTDVLALGPFEYVGSDSPKIGLEIESVLEKTRNYSIEVQVNTSYNDIIMSERHKFDTFNCAPSSLTTFSYLAVLTFSSLCILLFIL